MRRRLFVAALAATTTIVLAFCIPLARLVREVARERAVTAAERDASQVAGALAGTTDPNRIAEVVAAVEAAGGHRISVVLPGGSEIGSVHLTPDEASLGKASTAAFEVQADGTTTWVAPVRLGDDVAVVAVVVPAADLTRGVRDAWLMLAAVAVGLMLVAVVAADRYARAVTRPAVALADAAARVATGDLDVRVEPEGPPELARVAVGFNDLAARVGGLLAAERESVADLAHRLRTPLAAMRLDAESATDPEDRGRLLGDVEALERGVDAVISEARRPERHAVDPVCDLADVARDRTTFWSVLADDQHRAWRLDIAPGNYPVAVPPAELAAAVDALIDNVFTHTAPRTGFSVTVSRTHPKSARLVVRDQGSGFRDAAVVSRGVTGGAGTGLGLDIARRAAEAGGGALSLSSEGGAVVTIVLPLLEPHSRSVTR